MEANWPDLARTAGQVRLVAVGPAHDSDQVRLLQSAYLSNFDVDKNNFALVCPC